MNFEEFKNFLIRNKKDFIFIKNKSGREEIIFEGVKYKNLIYEKYLYFPLISKTKKDAKEFIQKNPDFYFYPRENIKFFKKINPKTKVYSKIDIKAAYWNCAKKVFLTEETYKLGIDKKASRLVALGSLASEKTTYFYENGEIKEIKTETRETAKLYFHIASQIDFICNECVLNGWANGYWVDCLFSVDLKSEKKIIEYLFFNGYETTKEKVNIFNFYENYLLINDKKFFAIENF